MHAECMRKITPMRTSAYRMPMINASFDINRQGWGKAYRFIAVRYRKKLLTPVIIWIIAMLAYEANRIHPLAWAARTNMPDMVEFLLARGAPTHLPDDPAWATPLAWAERRGHEEVAEILRKRGVAR